MGRRNGFQRRLMRQVKYRLIVPLLRSQHPPEYTAGGTAVGLAWAFTPTPGAQMVLVFVTWFLARRFFEKHFSLMLGLAWTWASNVFTGPPVLYLQYVTGQVLLGRWDDITGYASFANLWDSAFSTDQPLLQQIMTALKMAIRDWGLALWIGSIPWCALFGSLGYWWSLRFVQAHRRRRARRAARDWA